MWYCFWKLKIQRGKWNGTETSHSQSFQALLEYKHKQRSKLALSRHFGNITSVRRKQRLKLKGIKPTSVSLYWGTINTWTVRWRPHFPKQNTVLKLVAVWSNLYYLLTSTWSPSWNKRLLSKPLCLKAKLAPRTREPNHAKSKLLSICMLCRHIFYRLHNVI